jgi:hypothetical protein
MQRILKLLPIRVRAHYHQKKNDFPPQKESFFLLEGKKDIELIHICG